MQSQLKKYYIISTLSVNEPIRPNYADNNVLKLCMDTGTISKSLSFDRSLREKIHCQTNGKVLIAFHRLNDKKGMMYLLPVSVGRLPIQL
jgi:hypothetical protein